MSSERWSSNPVLPWAGGCARPFGGWSAATGEVRRRPGAVARGGGAGGGEGASRGHGEAQKLTVSVMEESATVGEARRRRNRPGRADRDVRVRVPGGTGEREEGEKRVPRRPRWTYLWPPASGSEHLGAAAHRPAGVLPLSSLEMRGRRHVFEKPPSKVLG
jgi:hypothetical protein